MPHMGSWSRKKACVQIDCQPSVMSGLEWLSQATLEVCSRSGGLPVAPDRWHMSETLDMRRLRAYSHAQRMHIEPRPRRKKIGRRLAGSVAMIPSVRSQEPLEVCP